MNILYSIFCTVCSTVCGLNVYPPKCPNNFTFLDARKAYLDLTSHIALDFRKAKTNHHCCNNKI